jgi:hypothetical protein
MCFVSVVTASIPNQYLAPISQWDFQTVNDFQEVIKRLDAIDKRLGARDCVDPVKEKFFEELAARVAVLEKAVAKG